MTDGDWTFANVTQALERGDCTRLAPWFEAADRDVSASVLREWVEGGAFRAHPVALAEALTTACWLGSTEVARYLLAQGVDAEAGTATGMNALHWAVNRGQLAAVDLLLTHGVALESRNVHGVTALGTAVWSARHESRPQHVAIVERLLRAGADVSTVPLPTGIAAIDALLRDAPVTHGDVAPPAHTSRSAVARPIEVTNLAAQLRTTDLASSIRFYTSLPGFTLEFQHQDFYAGIRVGRQRFHLKQVDEKDPSIEMVTHGDHLHLYFETPDAQAAAEAVEAAGVPLLRSVHRTPWETQEFVIRDDQGHTLYFGQPLEG
ncbi:MAG: VOC family protein [Gemmatimonadota bacterium]